MLVCSDDHLAHPHHPGMPAHARSHSRGVHNQFAQALGLPIFEKGNTRNRTVVNKRHNVTLTFSWRPRIYENMAMIKGWNSSARWPGESMCACARGQGWSTRAELERVCAGGQRWR